VTATHYSQAPKRKTDILEPDVVLKETADGVLYVRSKTELGEYVEKLTDRLDYWAQQAPDRIFMADRGPDGEWRTKTYAQMRHDARNMAQAILNRPHVSIERPIAILSGNDLEHATIALGALYAGVPYASISTAYSLVSSDFGKLRHIVGLITPGLVYVADAKAYKTAIETVMPADAEIVVLGDDAGLKTTHYCTLAATQATEDVDRAVAKVNGDTIAKFLFTSGSTGTPKAVINSQRMWCSTLQVLRSVLRFITYEPPVICQWLPWSHTFAGNHDFGMILYNGGSYYIDDGKAVPGEFDKTVRNLIDVAPTIYLGVPRAFELLIAHLKTNEELRKRFFSRVGLFYYAGAGVSQPVWDAYAELAVAETGQQISWFTGLGSTETGPTGCYPGPHPERAGLVGVPGPGVELKLVPNEGKMELRLRGPSIMPGYWRQPELTAASFDEEGFYSMGDALKFVDPSDPNRGFMFDGRIAEDFKLSSGTWVSCGPLRAKILAHCAPLLQDVVLAGPDRPYISALLFPTPDARKMPDLQAKLGGLLADLARESTGGSNRVARAMVMERPPSIDAHEITDKGSLNQRAIVTNRAALVDEIYVAKPAANVICV
jgi:feruloyl-CoA synthase